MRGFWKFMSSTINAYSTSYLSDEAVSAKIKFISMHEDDDDDDDDDADDER